MLRDGLNEEYFEWMYQIVCDNRYSKRTSFEKLMRHLNERQFTFAIPMDGNRADDGIDLRYRFGREKGYKQAFIASYLDNRPCSILEMMIALAIRCEEHIMEDDDLGDRTGQWFWNMIVSLGLGSMSDGRYDPDRVDDILDRFLDHDYEPDGHGGLFTLEYPSHDLRQVEIWQQLNMYLNEILDRRDI